MRSLRLSTRSRRFIADGLNKSLALIMLIVLTVFEVGTIVYAAAYGFRALGLIWFIASLWGLAACIALAVYILTNGRTQAGGYMEVSNYLNLNKLGKDK